MELEARIAPGLFFLIGAKIVQCEEGDIITAPNGEKMTVLENVAIRCNDTIYCTKAVLESIKSKCVTEAKYDKQRR